MTSSSRKRPAKSRGRFITFEGIDGAGKSTLIRLVAAELERHGSRVTVTREPGGTPTAEAIRSLLIAGNGHGMDPWTELFLYEAARAEHVAKTIQPALERGDWVLCDRYADSSLAYQGHARGLPWSEVGRLNRSATRSLRPDLTFLIDVDPKVALGRAQNPNRFEAEGLEFQKRARLGFLKASRLEPRRWRVVKAGADAPERLAERVLGEINRRFAR